MLDQFYCYVYHDENRVPIYVGKGSKYRANTHKGKSTNRRLHNKLKKMQREGKEPVVTITVVENEQAAFTQEARLIAQYGRADLNTGTLYNLSDGGEGSSGRQNSPTHRAKISAANTGKIHTPEARARMKHARSLDSMEIRKRRIELSRTPEARAIKSQKTTGVPRPQKLVTCPHCGKIGGNVMKYHHFDRCPTLLKGAL
jgi:NUMOD3 motif